MILHARFEGVHVALIHLPCLTGSLMLDQRLAQSSPCIIIIITFSLALYHCLFFHKFFSLSRSDHVENNRFRAWHMKFSFHQVFIHPQRTPIEWVMPILLRRCSLSKADFRLHIAQYFYHISLYGSSNSSILDVLEPALDKASDLLNMSDQVLKIDENSDVRFFRFGDGDARVRNDFGYDFSPLNLCLMPCMLVKLGIYPTICSVKVTSLTEHKASPRFTNHNTNKCIHNHNLWQSKLWLIVT
jgi:hypothetical protein